MSNQYQRTTRKHAVVVHHNDGDETEGYLHVPIGMAFEQVLMQAGVFLPFETFDGETAYLAMSGIKRVLRLDGASLGGLADRPDPEPEVRTAQAAAGQQPSARQSEGRRRREERRRQMAEAEARRAFKDADINADPGILEALAALNLDKMASAEEIHETYRAMVKMHHPDRLRGRGANISEINAGAEILARVNQAYSFLGKRPAA